MRLRNHLRSTRRDRAASVLLSTVTLIVTSAVAGYIVDRAIEAITNRKPKS